MTLLVIMLTYASLNFFNLGNMQQASSLDWSSYSLTNVIAQTANEVVKQNQNASILPFVNEARESDSDRQPLPESDSLKGLKNNVKVTKKTTTNALKKPGLVQGNNLNNFIDSGDLFTKQSINQYNNLDGDASSNIKSSKKHGFFSSLRTRFQHMTTLMSKSYN